MNIKIFCLSVSILFSTTLAFGQDAPNETDSFFRFCFPEAAKAAIYNNIMIQSGMPRLIVRDTQGSTITLYEFTFIDKGKMIMFVLDTDKLICTTGKIPGKAEIVENKGI